MKISYAWLKELFNHGLTPEHTGKILTATGLEVEGVELVEAVPGGMNGLVVGEVVTREKHPNADRLSVTTVNIGGDELLPIVCGAANVAAGQKVIVATVGAMLYPTSGEPFQIKKGKIRGEDSHGMICAEDEIGLGTSHDGIMVLDSSAKPGTPLADYFNVESDYCLEIGLTPNRTDAMSHLGVARDLRAAMMHSEAESFDTIADLKMPDVSAFKPTADQGTAIAVDAPDACIRYMGINVTGVAVAESPDWLKQRLRCIGVKPINNIVDITNYVLHEVGQPLHAFDASKIGGNKVVVRKAKEGEKFTTLDGIERALDSSDLMICDEHKPMCIAGVFGGQHSGISDQTTDVFIESAVFDPVFVRKTARRHLLHTDASYRFERGVDPTLTPFALERAALMMVEIAGGTISSSVTDLYPAPLKKARIEVGMKSLNTFIGKTFEASKVEAVLKSLDFAVVSSSADQLVVDAPLYRRDVTRQADVAEELLRIVGYDSIEIPTQVHASMSYRQRPDAEHEMQRVADMLVARGYTESMSNSLTKSQYNTLIDRDDLSEKTAVKIKNPLSGDLGQLRQTLLYQALEMVERNMNQRKSDIRSFEFGRIYHEEEGKIVERGRLALWTCGFDGPESWEQPQRQSTFYTLRSGVDAVLAKLGLQKMVSEQPHNHPFYTDSIALMAGKKQLGHMGVLSPQMIKAFDLKQGVIYGELDWDALMQLTAKTSVVFADLPRFPGVRRDLSLLIDTGVTFKAIRDIALKTETGILREVGLFDVYEGKNLEAGKKSYAVSFALQDDKGTLTDKRIDKTMERIQQALEQEVGARLRS